jgi:hypothetical protein
MNAGRTDAKLKSRFSCRSSSACFRLIFSPNPFSSASKSRHCFRIPSMASFSAATKSRARSATYDSSDVLSKLPEIASKNRSARDRSTRTSRSLPSKSNSRAPRSVMSVASARAPLIFLIWLGSPTASTSSASSSATTFARDAL